MFINYNYLFQVELNTVVQMELHILTRPGEKEEWMQKRHCQEIEMLLSDVIKNRVNDELKRSQTKKLRKKWAHCPQKPRSDFDTFTQPQILTGYRSLRIFREKLVVFVYHLAGYTSYQKGLVSAFGTI
ncbi:hypothetical protein LSH36_207g01017 [Paralvinella palmiformis]|uniref:Uncharacterized protein n=1 Tax=Paralvinella palmiformis TaxID=53620 RepID=A0AAD9JR76_9ANNE|nr:hypothetical protein LSH36_207g01017 [Paralvinella palmiformis]